jgi:hypothetical protein
MCDKRLLSLEKGEELRAFIKSKKPQELSPVAAIATLFLRPI